MVGSYVDSPLLYDHIHHIQNIIHLDSVMLYDLTLDTGNVGLPCGTLHFVDEGSKVAVSCCAVWSFSTLLMASARV